MPRVRPRSIALPCAVLALSAALACDGGTSAVDAPDPAQAGSEALARIGDGPHEVAVVDMGELGEIRFELLPEIAPRTVENFKKLAREGFYDGTTFHRVIPGFMIQGGDPLSRNADPRDDGSGGPGYTIEDEFSDYPHRRGTVAMANKGFPNSGASQFFIVVQDSTHLDGAYSVFGRVVDGLHTLDAVTELELDVYGRYGPVNRPYPVSATMHGVRIETAAEPEGDVVAHASSPSSGAPAAVAEQAPHP